MYSMDRRDVPDLRNSSINDPQYDNPITCYLMAFYGYHLFAMDNNQLISDSSDGNRVDLKSTANQLSQFLEENLYPGASDMIAMEIR